MCRGNPRVRPAQVLITQKAAGRRTYTSNTICPLPNNRLLLLLGMIIVIVFVDEIDCVEIYETSILLQQLFLNVCVNELVSCNTYLRLNFAC